MYLLTFFASFLVSTHGCGIPAIKPSFVGKIYNGQDAVPNSWPWMVSLRGRRENGSYTRHFCGGSIIDEKTILTAAHCVTPFNTSVLKIFVGLHNSSATPSASDIYSVSAIHIHPGLDQSMFRNDVAVVKLNKSLIFSDKVSTVCLPSANSHETLYGKDVVALGWGFTEEGTFATILQQADLLVLNSSFFDEIIKKFGVFIPTEQYAVLEDSADRDTGVCFGDSGGPLLNYDGSKWTLYGLSSYGEVNSDGNCNITEPSVFSSVPFYLDFIKNYTEPSLSSSSACLSFFLELFYFHWLLNFCISIQRKIYFRISI